MKIVFATHNQGKLRELRALLADFDQATLLTLDEVEGAPREIEETGATFAENASLKAVTVMRATGLPALADDSGLEVDALDRRPGVHSARYGGPGLDDTDRVQLLLRELEGVSAARRTARFRCVIAFADPATPHDVALCEASCEGHIAPAPRGERGFGYDPVFFVESLGLTFGEANPADKHRLSHRGQAMRKMADLLRERFSQR